MVGTYHFFRCWLKFNRTWIKFNISRLVQACIVSKQINFMRKFYLNPSGPYGKARMYARIVSRDVELNSTYFWIKFNTTRIKYNISCPARAYVILKCIVHMRFLSELLWSSLGGSHGIPFINVELNSTEFEFNSTFQPCSRLYDFQIHWWGLALQRSAICTTDGLTTSGGRAYSYVPEMLNLIQQIVPERQV